MNKRALAVVLGFSASALVWWKLRAPRATVEVSEVPTAQALQAIELELWEPIVSALDLVGFDMRPRGIRNNNPGNIRPAGQVWQGQIGLDDKGFAIMATPHDGLRMLARDLKSKAARGIDTVREVISVYAPPFENDTQSYVASVAQQCGVGADQVPNRLLLMKAIIRHENGQQPYTDQQIIAGISAA